MGLLVGLKRSGLATAASIIVSALVLLAAGALAAEETVTLGDYEVSFDLGNYTGYELDFEEMPYATVEGEDYNTEICWVRYDDGETMIAINDYVLPVEASHSRTRSMVVNFLNNLGCTNVNNEIVQIEGKPGILGMALSPSGSFMACIIFWPDIQEVNDTLIASVDCVIYSEYTENSVGLAETLLNSIRVRPSGYEDGVTEVGSEADRIEL